MIRVPGPGSGTIDVRPQDIASAAKAFSEAQSDLYNAWTTLQTALDNVGGMAGNDSPANSFNARYSPAVAAAWNALRSSALTVGGISTGLTQTANNFVVAEHNSSAPRNGPLSTFAPEPVFDGIEMASPSSAIGPGERVVPARPALAVLAERPYRQGAGRRRGLAARRRGHAVIGILGTVFTGGGSDAATGGADEAEVAAIVGDVAAETSATVEADMGVTIGGDLVATVEAAADDAPAVETAEAETTQVQGDLEGSLDKAMADAEGDPNLDRLSDSEAATLTRLQEEFPDRYFRVSAEERDGEYTDDLGRTYDQMGDPRSSQGWNAQKARNFYEAIDRHLLKSVDFTVIDLTGFSGRAITEPSRLL